MDPKSDSIVKDEMNVDCNDDLDLMTKSKSCDLETNDELSRAYYFESDHLALKGNTDYQQLLRTISLLESQRITAIKHLDQLVEAQKDALADPIDFVEKLQNKVDLNLPKPQNIAELPVIDWNKYSIGLDSPALIGHRHMTRNKKATDKFTPQLAYATSQQPKKEKESEGEVIRGRVKGESKPATFNQLWTTEEQQRLQQLLIDYPPEEVEMRRWEKIAKALGNRTTHQVASRVQKYFIKLAKAGLPVPGRIPLLGPGQRKHSGHKHQRNNRFYWKQSTFLQGHQPPVYMSDDDMDDTVSFVGSSVDGDALMDGLQTPDTEQELEPEEEFPEELHNTKEYQELICLQRVRREKLLEEQSSSVIHTGYKCDHCECEPIVGTRWNCLDCPTDQSVDFCDACADGTYETGVHNSSHRLDPIRHVNNSVGAHMDRDYMRFMQGDYNYLDPNYMPAS